MYLYLMPPGTMNYNNGIKLGLSDLSLQKLTDSRFRLGWSIDPAWGSEWTLNDTYTALMIFQVDYRDLIEGYDWESVLQYAYDKFSCDVSGRWLLTDSVSDSAKLNNKIWRQFPDAPNVDIGVLKKFPGTVSYPGDDIIHYDCPIMDWTMQVDELYFYEIYLTFTFINDYSSNPNFLYNITLDNLVYSSGSEADQVAVYPSFDTSGIDAFVDAESEALDSFGSMFESVQDDVFDNSLVSEYFGAFKGYHAASKIVNKLTSVPFVNNILKYSIVVGVLGLIAGFAFILVGRSFKR